MGDFRSGLPRDGLYRAILWVLVFDVVAGASLALGGRYLWQSPALAEAGTWLALAGGALYLFFRWWGRRQGRGGPGGEPRS